MRAVEEAAFRGFVADHGRELSGFAAVLARDAEDARDLLQATLTKVVVSWRSVSRADTPVAYMKTIMARTAADERRRRARRPVRSEQADLAHLADTRDDAAVVEQRDELQRLLADLPARERAAVVLRYLADYDERSTAAALGISSGAVKAYTSRGLAHLRALAHDTTGDPR